MGKSAIGTTGKSAMVAERIQGKAPWLLKVYRGTMVILQTY